MTKSVCEDNGGIWWGPGADDPITAGIDKDTGLTYCCNVNQFLAAKNPPQPPFSILPLSSIAIRNDRFKLVSNFTQAYEAASNACVATETTEFYAIDESVPIPLLDTADRDLLQAPPLTPVEKVNYKALTRQLQAVLDSQPACPGDGNIDGVVDQTDVADWATFQALALGKSSWYDFNLDGLTDSADLAVIQQNLGTRCKKK